MPVENRNGRHIDLSMKRAHFMDGNREKETLSMKRAHSMDGNRENDTLSMKRAGFMDKSRATGKKNKL